ncbi:phage Gp37/Gp68 family protein [Nibrella saemangeumensis]|uniref:Phage Gp37/Gp68 family protein n=1 Tax=Nibrella saemangeumensis TaxID=1084526 RepID=A0ABP8N7U8_9BACT
MAQSSIEWTEMTWNPTTGCNKISAGCKFCYAEVMAKRLQAMGVEKYQSGFELATHKDSLRIPYTWGGSKMVFVNSMSDLFHKDIPLSFIKDVFKVMNENPQHIFQILTKRADLLLRYNEEFNWTPNIWMGVSIEDSRVLDRIDYLIQTDAFIKFLSCEPLIGPLDNLDLIGIDWVIVGGESGRNPRPINKEWVIDIQQKCQQAKVAFFFKQWGGRRKKEAGRMLNGRTYNEMPNKRVSIPLTCVCIQK